MQENTSITAAQAVNEAGKLVLGELPLDLGLAQLLKSGEDSAVLSDGKVVQFNGTDDDILAVAADFNFRSTQIACNLYISGMNLKRLRDYLTTEYDYSPKDLWEKMTKLTGYNRQNLDNRIKMAERFTPEEVKLLSDSGATQTSIFRMLKAAPEKRQELLDEAREGIQLNTAVVDEVLGVDSEAAQEERERKAAAKASKEDVGDNIDDEPIEVRHDIAAASPMSAETAKSVKTATPAPMAGDDVIDVQGSFVNYASLVIDTKDYKAVSIAQEERLKGLEKAIESARLKHEISTVRGQAIRPEMAKVLAAYHGIFIPDEIEPKNEPKWVKDLRDKLPARINREFRSLYLMAYIEGHLSCIKGEKDAPSVYEKLLTAKTLTREGVDCLYDLWAEGYAQRKQVLDEQAAE